MPISLDLYNIPLPTLRTYTIISVTLFSWAVWFADQSVVAAAKKISNVPPISPVKVEIDPFELNRITCEYVSLVLDKLIEETWCLTILINMAYCVLILLGKVIQKLVFGELRVIEQQHLKDKLWNFLFYKFIFTFGVMNVQLMEEVFSWSAWFSVLGFLEFLAVLCRQRFEFMAIAGQAPPWRHIRILSLLLTILLLSTALMGVALLVGLPANLSAFFFMIVDCCLLSCRTAHTLVRYAIHLYDSNHVGVWEQRSFYNYYAELVFEMMLLLMELFHHLHMLVYMNIFLSMASLVICMQIRYLFQELQRRISKHKNYLRVVKDMELRFPYATKEDLDKNGNQCAICWEEMEITRKLPCGHLFHVSCLLSWLEQDTSCPTCRLSLNGEQPNTVRHPQIPVVPPVPEPPQFPNQAGHFFHFDASRYVSWLPSFSVEVTNTHLRTRGFSQRNSQLDAMARQVLDVLPQAPRQAVIEDLRLSHSAEITIDNFLLGRLRITAETEEDFNAGMNTDLFNEQNATMEPEVRDTSTNFSNLDASGELDDSSPEVHLSENVLATGGRFSKSASEREVMLRQRKSVLLEQAKKRFLQRQSQSFRTYRKSPATVAMAGGDATQAEESDPPVISRSQDAAASDALEELSPRELSYRAAQKRLRSDEL